jgi:hypothetical protein
MDIRSDKGVRITGPSIKFTGLSHTPQRRCSDSYWSFGPVMNNLLLDIATCLQFNQMVVGFTTTYAIDAYHHWCCEFESRSGWGAQHYVIKFVSVSSTNKTDHHDIIEILLKVALITINQPTIKHELDSV